jgi:RNase P/RNase MRP subunit POP5
MSHHLKERISIDSFTYEYIHFSMESEQRPDMATFKTLFHQQLQNLFGIMYSAPSIDILHYLTTEMDGRGQNITKVILRVISCDKEMILQTLPLVTAYQGHRCTIITHTCTPHLFLITNKA